jgi:hypothetical protein
MTFLSFNVQESIFKYKTLHLWTPYFYSGQPLMAIPESFLFDLNFLYILIFRNINLAMNLATISYFFLAGFGMYLLVKSLKLDPKIAFISALVYMFNGFMHSFVISGHLNILESYALLPFVFLFTYRAVKSKDWITNAILAGLFFAMMLLAGGFIFFLYTGILIGLFLLFNLIGGNFLSRALKIFLVGIALLIVLFGISSIKLLPSLEYTDISNRASGVSYTEFLGNPVNLANLWSVAVFNPRFSDITGAVGIAAFILLIMSFFSYRNKTVIFFLLLIVFSILLASGSFLSEILYKTAPGFDKLRHVERALVLFVFSASVLIAYGFKNLNLRLGKFGFYNKYKKIIYVLIVLLILTELVFLQNIPKSVEVIKPDEIPILDFISKDKEMYRTINLGLRELIGAAGYNYNAQLGIGEVKGGGGIWINDYVNYLAVSQQYNPSKLWGILNTKYIISNSELDFPNTEFVQKFEECQGCAVRNAFGPYLYENLEFLPRAYMADNSILVVGNKQAATQLIYSLILDRFDPRSTVLIQGAEKIDEHSLDFLKKFNAIILAADSVDQNSLPILEAYVNNGGIILPDVLNGGNVISDEELGNLFDGFGGNYSTIEITQYSNNKIDLDLKGKQGFLVLSESYVNFPGWNAFAGNKKVEMLKANNAITSVYVDGTYDGLTFKYNPKSFKYGAIITIVSLLVLTLFLSRKLFK